MRRDVDISCSDFESQTLGDAATGTGRVGWAVAASVAGGGGVDRKGEGTVDYSHDGGRCGVFSVIMITDSDSDSDVPS